MIPFLFTMGLCALSHAAQLQGVQMTDFIPQEEGVHRESLANGIVTYVQENGTPPHSGSFRVVLRKPSSKEVLYAYDGTLDSMEAVEQFFNYCKNRVVSEFESAPPSIDSCRFSCSNLLSFGMESPKDLAIIAVGDFPYQEIQELIQRCFGDMPIRERKLANPTLPIQITSNTAISKVAMQISYPIAYKPIQTFSDLKETWKLLFIQDLYQQRMERSSRNLEEGWIHPRPQFLYPVSGHAIASEEISENLLSFLLWQIESIYHDGYYEEEFFVVKRKLLNQLQYLSSKSARPDDPFLASYYVDQFLLGNQGLSHEAFLNASIQFIEELKSHELSPHIKPFLAEKNRSIQVMYPTSARFSELLTKNRIEEIIEQVSSLASFYRDCEVPDEDVWKINDAFPKESIKNGTLPIQLTSSADETPFCLAKNPETKAPAALPTATESFHQLPLNDKEKRLIKAIVMTMAEKNILQLAFEKSAMEKKGKKVNHVHPLRFIGYIFANAELKAGMRAIRKSSFKWDAFVDGFSRRMREEFSNDNLVPHIAGFAQQVGVSSIQVHHYVQKKDWDGLLKSLL